MATSYKNPARLVSKLEEVETAWATLAATESFGGMTLAEFRTEIAPSLTIRAQSADLQAQLSANIAARAIADAASNEKVKLVVNSVKGNPNYGENSALYRAMGYSVAADRASGLSRTVTPEPPVA